MKTVRWIILAAVWATSVCAEMRMWTDENGVRFRGEYNRELLGKIQIRDAEGKLHVIPLDKMSKEDLYYLETTVSPEVEIDFRQKSRTRPLMEWTIDDDRTELYTCTVTLTKKSRMESKVNLTAELYVIGDVVDGDNWVLLHREVSKFIFPEGRDSQHVFVANEVPCRKYYAAWADEGPSDVLWRGVTYLGYVVVVLDPKGNVVASKTDLGTQKWMDAGIPVVVEKLRKLYIEGRGSQFSRHFNEDIQKAKVPQLEWFKRSKIWR